MAENQAGQVDSEKAAAADLVGRGKDHDGTAGNQQGVQARGQGNAVDQPDQAKAARQTEVACLGPLVYIYSKTSGFCVVSRVGTPNLGVHLFGDRWYPLRTVRADGQRH